MTTTREPLSVIARTPSSVAITGATRGLGLATAMRVARDHPEVRLVLLGRSEGALAAVRDGIRRRYGTSPMTVRMDQSSLASVRHGAGEALAGLAAEGLRLESLVANVGVQVTDLDQVTADGFELTFGVNVLGTHLLYRTLLPHMPGGARVVLVGSGTADDRRPDGLVPVPRWEDPELLAMPGRGPDAGTATAGRRAYATSKLATVYLAHALARREVGRVHVSVLDPGLMPGTGLARDGSLPERIGWQLMRPLARVVDGASTPPRSGATLARMAVGDLVGVDYVALDRPATAPPAAFDVAREERLWSVADRLVGLDTDDRRAG